MPYYIVFAQVVSQPTGVQGFTFAVDDDGNSYYQPVDVTLAPDRGFPNWQSNADVAAILADAARVVAALAGFPTNLHGDRHISRREARTHGDLFGHHVLLDVEAVVMSIEFEFAE